MLIDFFFALRNAKVPVSIKEFLTLLEALEKTVIAPSLDEFYYLARLTLVKDEAHFDKFDRAFGAYFKGLENLNEHIEALIPEEWLRKEFERLLTDEEKARGVVAFSSGNHAQGVAAAAAAGYQGATECRDCGNSHCKSMEWESHGSLQEVTERHKLLPLGIPEGYAKAKIRNSKIKLPVHNFAQIQHKIIAFFTTIIRFISDFRVYLYCLFRY